MQVRQNGTFETVCGVLPTRCEVANGTYKIKNVTAKTEDANWIVNDSAVHSINVDGNLISWPANGYYEVQKLPEYDTVCEGTDSCEVEPGDYVVINHWTGVRVPQNVGVPDSCLLYTSPSPRDGLLSRMPSSA